jgi:hypothetical protein
MLSPAFAWRVLHALVTSPAEARTTSACRTAARYSSDRAAAGGDLFLQPVAVRRGVVLTKQEAVPGGMKITADSVVFGAGVTQRAVILEYKSRDIPNYPEMRQRQNHLCGQNSRARTRPEASPPPGGGGTTA